MPYITFQNKNGKKVYYRGIEDDKILTTTSIDKAKRLSSGYFINAEVEFLKFHFPTSEYPIMETLQKENSY